LSAMATAGMIRRIRTVAVEGLTEQVDDLPTCLKQFPNSSNVVKDIHLGVLLGRQVTHDTELKRVIVYYQSTNCNLYSRNQQKNCNKSPLLDFHC
jgi:hypothetical protein